MLALNQLRATLVVIVIALNIHFIQCVLVILNIRSASFFPKARLGLSILACALLTAQSVVLSIAYQEIATTVLFCIISMCITLQGVCVITKQ